MAPTTLEEAICLVDALLTELRVAGVKPERSDPNPADIARQRHLGGSTPRPVACCPVLSDGVAIISLTAHLHINTA
eukprot:scaffold97597_cov43-Prasinocladus_malaysianus.AAC.1